MGIIVITLLFFFLIIVILEVRKDTGGSLENIIKSYILSKVLIEAEAIYERNGITSIYSKMIDATIIRDIIDSTLEKFDNNKRARKYIIKHHDELCKFIITSMMDTISNMTGL